MKGRQFGKTLLMILLENFRIAVLVLLLAEIIHCEGGVNTCNTKTFEGSSAKMTCSFHKNAVRKNLFIEHLTGDPFDNEIVVFCQLTEGRYVCTYKDGYHVFDNITDHLTLNIRKAHSKHAGIYMFGGFQPDPLERIQCRLTVMRDPNLNKQISARPSEKTILTDKSVPQGEIKEDEMSASTSIITIPFIVLMVVAYTLIIIIMTKTCRYPCRMRRRTHAIRV